MVFLCDELYVPMRTKEIAMLLDIPKSKRQDLQEVLDALVEEGKAQVSKKGKYQKAEKVVKEGAFISHAKGFGFVCVEDEGEDYYIPEEYVGNAFHGDQVRIELLSPSKGKRREAVKRSCPLIFRRSSERMKSQKIMALSYRTMQGSRRTSLSRRGRTCMRWTDIRWSVRSRAAAKNRTEGVITETLNIGSGRGYYVDRTGLISADGIPEKRLNQGNSGER